MKTASFLAGVKMAMTEGAVKTVAGVTKVFRDGRWVSPSAPKTLQSVAYRPKSP